MILALVADGCISDQVGEETSLTAYQQQLAKEGPQARVSTEEAEPSQPQGLLQPVEPMERALPELDIKTDPNTGKKAVALTMEQAITRTLANSPEIRVVSFDPEIARQEITKAAGVFDPVAFDQITWDDQDDPQNSYFEPGRADRRLFESGVRQRTPLGSEWSASYAFARNWDDLFGRTLSTRYEPMLLFQLKQPLLRDAWQQVNLAGVDIARLEHQVALIGFRDKAESVSADVIATYWRLVQAVRNLEIQRTLVEQTVQTLHKVDGRREIDATDVQLMQVRAFVKIREADLLEVEKQVMDAQDALVRLMADPRVNTTSDLTIVPTTMPDLPPEPPESAKAVDKALATAMLHNPAVQEAQIRIKIAEINVEVAQNQRMPRLDLIGSVRAQGLGATSAEAHEQLEDRQYTTYGVGLSFRVPAGQPLAGGRVHAPAAGAAQGGLGPAQCGRSGRRPGEGKGAQSQTTMEQTVVQKDAVAGGPGPIEGPGGVRAHPRETDAGVHAGQAAGPGNLRPDATGGGQCPDRVQHLPGGAGQNNRDRAANCTASTPR